MKTMDWSKTESFNDPNSEGAAETKWVYPDKTLVTTPNSDVIYAMSYVDLGKDGPIVFNKGA
jgi:hypothetical protein